MFGLATSTTSSGFQLSVPVLVVLAVVAGLALFVACKIGKFLLKVVFAVLVLAAIAGAVWWLWLRQ